MNEDRKLRIAVVGTGEWWGYHHARIYHSRPDTELVGILGRTQAKADARASEFGVSGYTELERMLDEERTHRQRHGRDDRPGGQGLHHPCRGVALGLRRRGQSGGLV